MANLNVFNERTADSSGTASQITVADAAGDTTTWVVLVGGQTGAQSPLTDAGITFNANTNVLTAVGGIATAFLSTTGTTRLVTGGNDYIYTVGGTQRFAFTDTGLNVLYSGGAGGFAITNQTNTTNIFSVSDAGAVSAPFTLSNAGHGTTASAANTYIDAGTGLISRSTSSLRYKTAVKNAPDSLADIVLQLNPITYKSLSPNDKSDAIFYGLAAEDVALIDPRLVHYMPSGKKTVETSPAVEAREATEDSPAIGARPAQFADVVDLDSPLIPDAVQYERLVLPLIMLAKRQQAQITSLEQRVTALENW